MIGKDDVIRIQQQLSDLEPPVLSVYADVNPAKPENANRAWALRVKNGMKALELPRDVEKRALEALELERPPEARTLALFVTADGKGGRVVRQALRVDLPVVDLANGRVETRWGDPYVAPLAYALDEYERAAVVWLHRGGWRFFEVFLGEIEEHGSVFADVAPDLWGELQTFDVGKVRATAESRTTGNRDWYARRMESAAHRHAKHLAHLVDRAVTQMGIRRLVLMGHEEATKTFADLLPRGARAIVVAHVSDLPISGASPARVLEKVQPALDQAERAAELALLERIREQPGVWGLDPTLLALGEGRLSVLVAPWELDARVWRADTGLLAGTAETAAALCQDGDPEEVALRDVIVDACAAVVTRLEFVSGPPAELLRNELGGLAGLTRW